MGSRGVVSAAGDPDGDPGGEGGGGVGGVPGEPGYPGSPGGAPARGAGGSSSNLSRRFTASEKLELLRAYEDSGDAIEVFCRAHGVTSASLCKWRRQFVAGGSAAVNCRLAARPTALPQTWGR